MIDKFFDPIYCEYFFIIHGKTNDKEIHELFDKYIIEKTDSDEDTQINRKDFIGKKQYSEENSDDHVYGCTGEFKMKNILKHETIGGQVFKSNSCIIIRFRENLNVYDFTDISTVSHEAFHGMSYIYNSRGVEYDSENDESSAYYIGFIVENILRILWKKKEIKKQRGKQMLTKVKVPRTQNEFKDVVGDSEFIITFIKKNGDERILRGTLDINIIEENDAVPNGTGYELPENKIHVFDVENKGWRTVILENLLSIDFDLKVA